MCESYSNTAWSWARRASHSPWPEASGNNTSHQDFVRRQSYRQGPEELRDGRAILFPTDESWGLVRPWASPLHYSVILSREALLLENGNQRHGFFLSAHSSICSFSFSTCKPYRDATLAQEGLDPQFAGDWENILQQDQHKLPPFVSPRKASSMKPVPKCCLTGTLGLTDYSHFCMKAHSKAVMPRTHRTSGWMTVETHFSPSQYPKFSVTGSLINRFVFWTLFKPQSGI